MKRDNLRKILGEEVAEDVIEAIMAENGKDVNAAKASGDQLRTQLAEAKQRVSELELAASENMTEQEKWQAQLDAANLATAQAVRELNEASAVAVFASAGIEEDEYKPFLGSIVGGTREETVASARAIADVVSAKVEAARADAEKAAMAGMGKPGNGDPAAAVTKRADFDALTAEEKIKMVRDNPGILSQLK